MELQPQGKKADVKKEQSKQVENMTRKLIVLPVIHPIDEVSYKIKVRRLPIHTENYSIFDNHMVIDEFWKKLGERLEMRLEELNFDYRKIRVYQDGIDRTPTEKHLLLLAMISKNLKIVLKLYKKGAIIMRTESKYLLDEQNKLKNILLRMEEIRNKRDRYIAKNIGKTLKEDEIGILFVGFGHDVQRFLSPDIDVEYGFVTKRIHEKLRKIDEYVLSMPTKEITEGVFEESHKKILDEIKMFLTEQEKYGY